MPNMRTINECLRDIKEKDPKSAITYNSLMTLCKEEKVNSFRSGVMWLIDWDDLALYASSPTRRARGFEYGTAHTTEKTAV